MLLKDPLDTRDLIFPVGSFPPAFDLKQYVSKVENQGNLASCTNEAVAMAMEILIKQFKPSKYEEMSRVFVWWNVREIEGNTTKNDGAYNMRNVNKALEKFGNCYERFCNTTNYKSRPSKEAYKNASKLKVKSYQRCTTPEQVKTAISSGFPVVLAMRLHEGFPKFDEGYLSRPVKGGHAMVIVGYTETHAVVLNSWGDWWDGDGYVDIPWDVLMADSPDLWAITGIKTWLDKALGILKGLWK